MYYRVFIAQFNYYLPGAWSTFAEAYERGLSTGFEFSIEQLENGKWTTIGRCITAHKWQETAAA